MKTELDCNFTIEEYIKEQISNLEVGKTFTLREICNEKFENKNISELGRQFAKEVSKNTYGNIERIAYSKPAKYIKKEKVNPFIKQDRI